MKERRSLKYRNPKRFFLSILFSLICLSGAAGGLWFFWADLNQFYSKSSEKSVGILSYKRNKVHRRFNDSLAWNILPGNSSVYNGDLIRTADLSNATIKFISEDSVSLAENTLIIINYNELTGEAEVELIGGKVSVHSVNGKLSLFTDGKELKAQSGSDTEIENKGGQIKFLTVRGHAEIHSPGESYNLAAGQSAFANADGITVSYDTLAVLEPLPDQEFINEDGEVRFSWTSAGLSPDEYVYIEAASDRYFTNITGSVTEFDPSVTTTKINFSPGIWWWRMFQAKRGTVGPGSLVREGRITVALPTEQNKRIALASPIMLAELSTQRPLTVPLREIPVSPLPAEPAISSEAPVLYPAVNNQTLLPRAAGILPRTGTIIDGDFLTNNKSIVFSWNAVDGANAYLCTIRQGRAVLFQTNEPRLEFDQLETLANGLCVFQIEAVALAADGTVTRRGLIAESRLTIAAPRPEAPQVNNPGTLYGR